MISVQEAEEIILNLVHPLEGENTIETVDLSAACGRILAKNIISALDFPHWDNSAMDGYAVRFVDIQNCSLEQPAILKIIEEIPAGVQPQLTVETGQAMRIFTGSMMPLGADTVIMQEYTQREDDRVLIYQSSQRGSFVRHQGEFYQRGNSLLSSGISLNPPEIAILAAAQCPKIPVYRPLNVGILSTGDELISPEEKLRPGKIVDSNQYALMAAIIKLGMKPIIFGIIPDDPLRLKASISQALNSADVVLSTGGVSVGDYDYVEEILKELGGEIFIRRVAVKPGKPLTVASFSSPQTLYFGLPGNPVSTLVTFWRFVQPALKKMSGLNSGFSPHFIPAKTRHFLRGDEQRESYLWGQLTWLNGVYEFESAGGSHSSGNLINLALTNGLACLPLGQTIIPEGSLIQVLPIR